MTSPEPSPRRPTGRLGRWLLPLAALVTLLVLVLWMTQRRESVPASAPQEQATPQGPREGGIYTEALIGRPGRFNPLFEEYNPSDRDLNRLVYCRLLTFNAQGIPQGDLATSWGISADAKIYNFALREDARWHDGEPVTAEDVAFTIERMREEAIPVPETWKALWQQVEVVVLDPYTLQFRLPQPFAPFLDYLSFGILPKHVWQDISPEEMRDHPLNMEPVGCGPYRFDHLLLEEGNIQGVVLKAYEDYYQGRPYIDEIVFRYYPTPQAALTAYEEGEVLGLSEITLDILAEALRLPNLNFYTARRPRLTLIYLNLGEPTLSFFTEGEVRKALLMALDRERLIQKHLQGQAIVAHSPIFPDSWAYYENIPKVPYDPQQADKLLREAGYIVAEDNIRAKEDTLLRFTLLYPDTERYHGMAQDIQKAWQQLGVQVTLEALPYEELIQRLEARDYEAALVDLDFTRSPDPDPYPFWHESQAYEGQNYSVWKNRRASLFLERARITPDMGKRRTYYRNFQFIFAQEWPALPLFYPVYTYGVDRQVRGIRLGPIYDASDRFQNVLEWYMMGP